MRFRKCLGLAAGAIFALNALGQSNDEDFKIYKDHPRLLLTPQRLKLLRREKERASVRWQQLDTLIRGKAQMPEPGFAFGLYYEITGDEQIAKKAIAWALGPGTDLRQLALVYDWCNPALSTTDSAALRKKIAAATPKVAEITSVSSARSSAFGLIALGEELPGSDKALEALVNGWWRKRFAPGLKDGSRLALNADLYPLYEFMHVIRDNAGSELREDAPQYFKDLPAFELLSYYPATYPAPENDLRIPAFTGKGDPDFQRAALSRAAELSMVAYDNVSTDSQFLQGWLLHDRFILHSTFGAPYEMLWANPYQPGLSFYHLPLHIHDPLTGRLFLRSSWDEDAEWLGYFNGELQVFEGGKIHVVSPGSQKAPIHIGSFAIIPVKDSLHLTVPADGPLAYYLIGLKPHQTYRIEVDDEELSEQQSDTSGILSLTFTRKDERGLRVSQAANP